MKVLKTLGAVVALAVLTTLSARADFINGTLTMAGEVQLKPANADDAEEVTSLRNGIVMGADGDFEAAGLEFLSNISTPNGFAFPRNGMGLTILSVGGFTFDVNKVYIVTQANDVLGLRAVGTLSKVGFEPTPYEWLATTQGASSKGYYAYSASLSRVSVPDGGLTVSLLGMGLASLGFFARRKAA